MLQPLLRQTDAAHLHHFKGGDQESGWLSERRIAELSQRELSSFVMQSGAASAQRVQYAFSTYAMDDCPLPP